MGIEKQRVVEEGLGDRKGVPVVVDQLVERHHLQPSAITPAVGHRQAEKTYASLTPRYVLVKAKVKRIKSLSGPPVGSLTRTTRRSPNRRLRMEAGRAPAGASKRRKSTAKMRSSPTLNDFLVVLIVVLICSLRSSIVMHRFSRFSSLKPCFFAKSRRTCRGGKPNGCGRRAESKIPTVCMPRFIAASIFRPVALSKTRRNTFQYVLRELFFFVPRMILPFLPALWFRRQSKKMYNSWIDRDS